jgi:hypothetical protein
MPIMNHRQETCSDPPAKPNPIGGTHRRKRFVPRSEDSRMLSFDADNGEGWLDGRGGYLQHLCVPGGP